MKYELIGQNDAGQNIYGRIDDDGIMRVSCVETDPDYLRWLNGDDESGTL